MARSEAERSIGGWVRYGLPGLAVGLALAWGLEGRGPSALAQAPQGPATYLAPPASPERSRPATAATASEAASGTIAMAVPGPGSSQYLYLIDARARALAVYRVDPQGQEKGALKLVAVRQYHSDLQLTEYNNLPPEVAVIQSAVRDLGRQPTR